MKTLAGQNNLLITWRPDLGGAELTRVETWDTDVLLPETIEGLPVTALGDHAFAPGGRTAEGERLAITCGPTEQEPDTRKLERITLPPTLRRVGDYAFYNCLSLREVRLSEPVEHWGGNVFMNCRELDTFVIRARDERAESVSYFADELPGELDVTVEYPDGIPARLIFPGYLESYEENLPAHHFDYAIQGPGYPYHHVFRSRALFLKDYDRLWPALLGMEHDPDCALRLAWYRLRLPRELTPEAQTQYLGYLRRHASETLAWLLERRDSAGLGWFLPRADADRETLRRACEKARAQGAAEPLALLLEEQHRRFPDGAEKSFAL